MWGRWRYSELGMTVSRGWFLATPPCSSRASSSINSYSFNSFSDRWRYQSIKSIKKIWVRQNIIKLESPACHYLLNVSSIAERNGQMTTVSNCRHISGMYSKQVSYDQSMIKVPRVVAHSPLLQKQLCKAILVFFLKRYAVIFQLNRPF